MKCIKAIKSSKSGHIEIDEIRKTDDNDAHSKVLSGYWKYVPKSEYKNSGKISSNEVNDSTELQIVKTPTINKKKVRGKKH